MRLTLPRACESLGELKRQIRIHWAWEESRDSAVSPAPGDAVLPALALARGHG